MKIIMSKAVMAEANIVGQQVCLALELPAKDLSADEVMQGCVAATAELQNVRYEIVGDELHCIIDDKLVLATLRIYGKVAHYVKALFELAKPFFTALKTDIEEVNRLAAQPRLK